MLTFLEKRDTRVAFKTNNTLILEELPLVLEIGKIFEFFKVVGKSLN